VLKVPLNTKQTNKNLAIRTVSKQCLQLSI